VESKRSRPPATMYRKVYLRIGVKQGGRNSQPRDSGQRIGMSE
jgi:hypothetical protein